MTDLESSGDAAVLRLLLTANVSSLLGTRAYGPGQKVHVGSAERNMLYIRCEYGMCVIWHAMGVRDLVNPPNVDDRSWSLALNIESRD